MHEWKRIVCPTDFSPPSRRALGHAVALARRFGSSLTLLHVTPPYVALPFAFDPPGLAPTVTEEPQSLLDTLERFAQPAREADVPVELMLDAGYPVDGILDLVRRTHADLIVMGTHGERGLRRWLLGSVTERVLGMAACPVVTVPPADAGPSEIGQAEGAVLCPVDFSEGSPTVVRLAASLAGKLGARLLVLHVLEGPGPEAEARARMSCLLSRARATAVAEPVFVSGRPYREILRTAAERGAGWIVLGLRNRSALDRMRFGFTANHVVREASCPVLTVRPRVERVEETLDLVGSRYA